MKENESRQELEEKLKSAERKEAELEQKEADLRRESRGVEREERKVENQEKHLEKEIRELVTIFVDNKPFEVHRGHHTVASIKTLAGVPQAYELEEVLEGPKLVPLADNASVTIKGGEKFISHPRDNASS